MQKTYRPCSQPLSVVCGAQKAGLLLSHGLDPAHGPYFAHPCHKQWLCYSVSHLLWRISLQERGEICHLHSEPVFRCRFFFHRLFSVCGGCPSAGPLCSLVYDEQGFLEQILVSFSMLSSNSPPSKPEKKPISYPCIHENTQQS